MSVNCIHAKVMLLTNFVKTWQCAKVIHYYACIYTAGIAMNDDFHTRQLKLHCRFCSGKLGKNIYPCKTHTVLIRHTAYVNTEFDQSSVHPASFCNSCYATLTAIDREQKSGLVSLRQFTVHQWVPHTTECEVCGLFQKQEKGGRMKKAKGVRGRRKPVIAHIQEIAGTGYVAATPLLLERFQQSSTGSVELNDLACVMCGHIVDRPVQLPCGSLMCAMCCVQNLHGSDEMSCPTCHQPHGDPTHFQPVSSVVRKVLGDLILQCENCNKPTHLCQLRNHITSGCREHTTSSAGGHTATVLTVQQLIDQPPTAPVTKLERQAATSVVRRMMAEDPVITLPTGGHVSGDI